MELQELVERIQRWKRKAEVASYDDEPPARPAPAAPASKRTKAEQQPVAAMKAVPVVQISKAAPVPARLPLPDEDDDHEEVTGPISEEALLEVRSMRSGHDSTENLDVVDSYELDESETDARRQALEGDREDLIHHRFNDDDDPDTRDGSEHLPELEDSGEDHTGQIIDDSDFEEVVK